MTVSMSIVETIRRLDRDGISSRKIAAELNLSRTTVMKYLNMEDFSPKPPRRTKTPGAQALSQHQRELIESWLDDDQGKPRKQRHTAKRVYDRLVAEAGYDRSYSPVQRFVKQWQEKHRSLGDGHNELVWPPGVVQVDFGYGDLVIGGSQRTYPLLVITFPYSNMRFMQAFEGETAECVITGLMNIMDFAGGTPRQMIFDNATQVGRRMGRDIMESKMFNAFRAHYRTTAKYCNPNSGNEKGNVENAVGFIRRNCLVPIPTASNLREINQRLLDFSLAAGCEPHYKKKTPIIELFADDKHALLPMPSVKFEPIRYEVRTTDKTGTVTIDNNRYLVGPSWHRRRVTVALSFDTVTMYDDNNDKIIALPRVFGTHPETVFSPASLLPILRKKPGAWDNSLLRRKMPDPLAQWLDEADNRSRREFFSQVEKTSQDCSFDAVMRAAVEMWRATGDPYGPGLDMMAHFADEKRHIPPSNANLNIYDSFGTTASVTNISTKKETA